MTTKVAIHGAGGRMGQRLVALTLENPLLQLSGAFEHDSSVLLGKDAGQICSGKPCGIVYSSQMNLQTTNVVIDFSSHHALKNVVENCVQQKVALVCGTTGLQADDLAVLEKASLQIPLLYGPNLSIGVNLLFKMAEMITRMVGDDTDIEVIEAHHRHKKDAPSGTAIRLAELIAKARNLQLDKVGKFSREGLMPERDSSEIGVQSIRGGDIIGEHTVYFCNTGERIELTHRATSRDIFVRGALIAAEWVAKQPPGKLYDMFDYLQA